MDEVTKKAYGYVRVSTEDQADGASPATQHDAIQAYADKNNIEIVEWFEDLGVSAKTAHRPGLQSLLKKAKQDRGNIDHLVVYNVSRISRNLISYAADIGLNLAKCGITLRSTLENIDETPQGKMMLGISLVLHQLDNDMKSQVVHDNMSALAQEGWWMTQAPLGLKLQKVFVGERDKNGKQKYHNTLIPDDSDGLADKIQQILIRFSEGDVSQADLARLAARQHIRTRTGKLLGVKEIGRLLTQPVYAGYSNSKTLLGGKMTKIKFDGLISLAVYEKNQRILAGDKREFIQHEDELYPLLHTLKCSHCGRDLLASAPKNGSGKPSPRYHCRCKGHGSINTLEAHNTFNNFLQQITPKEGTVRLFKEIVKRTSARKLGEVNKEIVLLESKKGKLDEKRLATITACLDDKITKEEKDLVCDSIDKERLTLERKLDQLNKAQRINEATVDYVCNFIDMPAKLWRDADLASKQAFQKMLFPNGLRIDLKTQSCGTEDLGSLFSVVSTKKASEDASDSHLVNLVESKWNDLISDFYRIKGIMSVLYDVNAIPRGGRTTSFPAKIL